jgi:hypothetical protein
MQAQWSRASGPTQAVLKASTATAGGPSLTQVLAQTERLAKERLGLPGTLTSSDLLVSHMPPLDLALYIANVIRQELRQRPALGPDGQGLKLPNTATPRRLAQQPIDPEKNQLSHEDQGVTREAEAITKTALKWAMSCVPGLTDAQRTTWLGKTRGLWKVMAFFDRLDACITSAQAGPNGSPERSHQAATLITLLFSVEH